MMGNYHVRFLGEGRTVMLFSYPTMPVWKCLYHPEYVGKPLAVGGDSEARHGIVLTANYIAKRSGVKTGMALWQAKQVCPDLIFVPPRMDLYLKFSSMLSEKYIREYTDLVEPYGCDEAWLRCIQIVFFTER
ncbi:MAG: hypothetical protein ACLU9T_18250 [Blautia faecis]